MPNSKKKKPKNNKSAKIPDLNEIESDQMISDHGDVIIGNREKKPKEDEDQDKK